MRKRLAAAGAILGVGLLGACTGDVAADEPYRADAATQQLVAGTATALESYWTGVFSSFSESPFDNPRGLVLYDDTHEPEVESCRIDGPGDWVGNSFYCPGDNVLYLNPDLFARLGNGLGNPAFGGIVVHAHEYGHHLAEIDNARFATPTIGSELQADCYAGAFLGALQDGDVSIPGLGPIALFDAIQTIRQMGDKGVDFDDDLAWFEEGAHGGPAERAYALALGSLTGDARYCQAYELTRAIDKIQIGSYQFTLPPATIDIPFGDVHLMTSQAFPAMTLKVSSASITTADPTAALAQVIPGYFAGARMLPIEPPDDFVDLAGLASASFRYQQDLDGRQSHGVLVLATRRDGTAILLDMSAAGPSPDNQGWKPLGDAVFTSLWGVYFTI